MRILIDLTLDYLNLTINLTLHQSNILNGTLSQQVFCDQFVTSWHLLQPATPCYLVVHIACEDNAVDELQWGPVLEVLFNKPVVLPCNSNAET